MFARHQARRLIAATLGAHENGRVRSRPISPRECARLMGLSDAYQLPANVTEALSLAGDGVPVPIVRHLAERLLEPILAAALREN